MEQNVFKSARNPRKQYLMFECVLFISFIKTLLYFSVSNYDDRCEFITNNNCTQATRVVASTRHALFALLQCIILPLLVIHIRVIEIKVIVRVFYIIIMRIGLIIITHTSRTFYLYL